MQFSFLAILTFVCASPGWADVNGSISGTVKDPSSAVVPRADVQIIDLDTNVSQTVKTTSAGVYSFLSLPVGRYQLVVKAPGFESYQQNDIQLNTNDELRFDILLRVGDVAESVKVETNAVHVETANTQLGDVITGNHIENMPLNGRQFTDLLGLQSGVVPQISATYGNSFASSQQGNVSINGQRETSNGFYINGSNVDNAVNNGATIVPNLDSLSEFRVITSNFDAEHGNYSGGIVSVVTKSGTNEFHGTAFDYFRNTALDSRGFFDSSVQAFQRNQFGGVIGGPIRKNKIFFFADYQGTLSNVGQESIGQFPVPSAAERGGDFSTIASNMTGSVGGSYFAGLLSKELGYPVTNGENYYTPGCTSPAQCVFPNGVIPAAAITAPAKALLSYIPTANVGSNFASSANVYHTRDNLIGGRLDFNTEHRGTFSGYFNLDRISINKPFGATNTPGFPSRDGGQSLLATLSHTFTFSASMLNELHLSFNRHVYHNDSPVKGLGVSLSSLGFNENQPGGIVNGAGALEGFPVVSFNNFSIGNPGVNYNRYIDKPSVADNFSEVLGKHTLKFGGQYVFDNFYEPMPLVGGNGVFGFNGTETGVDFADFLIGAPTYFVQEGGFNVDNRRNYMGLYAQDSWRAKPNLTINYGLRWDVLQPWYEKRNQASTFVQGVQSTVYSQAPIGYVFPGDKVPGYGTIPNTIARTEWRNFGPRLGFAWSPSAGGFFGKLLGGADKFSVRGGIGLFYNNLEGASEIDETGLAPFDVYYPAPLPVLFASPYTNRVDGGTHQPFPFTTQSFPWQFELPLSGYPVIPIDQKVPYTESYNLTIQRQFGNSTVWSLGYIGNQSHHLLTQLANNPGNPQLCLSLSQPNQVAPGTQTCGPFLENATFTRADGTVVVGTRQPYGLPNFGDNIFFATVANSAYNSFQTSLSHTSGRLTFTAAYTFSKSLDNSSNLQDRQPNPLNTRLSRGLSSFDVTHNFVVSYNYALPFDTLARNRLPQLTKDWRLAGITHLATGFPIYLFESDDHSLLGNSGSTDTPDFLGGDLHLQDPRKANITTGIPYFNTTLFAPSRIGYEGTANKAFFHGPGIANFDMALLKDITFTERYRLQFRAEFFNVFNHAQFLNPNGNITTGSSTFGIITQARPGRIGQLALKIVF